MQRKMEKIIEDVKINSRYDLTIPDIQELINKYQDESYESQQYDIICDAFRFGYAMGSRATASELKKKGKA